MKEASDAWEPLSDYVFLDASRGYRITTNGLERTADGGKTVSLSPMPKEDTVLFIDANACLVSGPSGLKASHDMGFTFISLPDAAFPPDHGVIQIARAPHVWVLASSAADGARHTPARLLTLADGATSWRAP